MSIKEKLINLILDDFITKNGDFISITELQRELDTMLAFKTTVNDIVVFDGVLTISTFFRDKITNKIKSVTFTK